MRRRQMFAQQKEPEVVEDKPVPKNVCPKCGKVFVRNCVPFMHKRHCK